MLRCANCGFPVDDDAAVCPYCGKDPRVREPEAAKEPVSGLAEKAAPAEEPRVHDVRWYLGPDPEELTAQLDALRLKETAARKKYNRVRIIQLAVLGLVIAATLVSVMVSNASKKYEPTVEKAEIAKEDVPVLSADLRTGDSARFTFTRVADNFNSRRTETTTWTGGVPAPSYASPFTSKHVYYCHYLLVETADARQCVLKVYSSTEEETQNRLEKRLPEVRWTQAWSFAPAVPEMTVDEVTAYGTLLDSKDEFTNFITLSSEQEAQLALYKGKPVLNIDVDTFFRSVELGDERKQKSLENTANILRMAAVFAVFAFFVLFIFRRRASNAVNRCRGELTLTAARLAEKNRL